MKSIILFSDGSCLGNPGKGGWAYLLKYRNYKKHNYGSSLKTTNNRMELLALIKGLEALNQPCKVDAYTDSKYIVNAFTNHWVDKWSNNGWLTSNKEPVKNQDLWLQLLNFSYKHTIRFHWVKGHAFSEDNNFVDELAKKAADESLNCEKDIGFENQKSYKSVRLDIFPDEDEW